MPYNNPLECTVVVVTRLPDVVFTDYTGKTSNLISCLDALQFRNGPSYVYANQTFGWQQFCGLYTEPVNVSTVRFGWDAMREGSYLFENPGDSKKQRSPPTGMRSAVPLGGLGKAKKQIPTLFPRSILEQQGDSQIVALVAVSFANG